MVKIERLQEWADSDKCLSVMEKRLFINLYESFYKLNTIIFYCKMAQFLGNNMYFLFYKIFQKLHIFSYFGLLKPFPKTSYRK